MLNGGDSLARGAKSAQFATGGKRMSEMKWNLQMMTEKEFRDAYPEPNGKPLKKAAYSLLLKNLEEGYLD